MDDQVIICRCEEITYGEIKQAIKEGAVTLDGIKRMTRAGKGLCQGRTCRMLINQIIREETQKEPSGDQFSSCRPPVRTVSIEEIMNVGEQVCGEVQR